MPKIYTSGGQGTGGGIAGVTTVNALAGDVILAAGTNVTITDDGIDTITINATGGGGGGITSINSDSTAAQTLSVGASGTDFAIVDGGGGSHTLNLPDASASARGVITTGAQTIAGQKTLSSAPILSSLTASQAVVTDGSKVLSSLAYASANTASALVQRDGSGNFTAGTITAALTGTASGNTTYTANQYGVVVSGVANAMSVIAPDASTTKVLKSGGASANPSWLAYDNANTVSTLVFRDGSGNFTAGTITAALTGAASSNVLKAGDTMTGTLINSFAGTASNSAILISGTPFSGGTSTSTKPQLNVDSGASSNGWSTSGTLIGANSSSTFTGNLIDLQKNAVKRFAVSAGGITSLGNPNNTRQFAFDYSSSNIITFGKASTNACIIVGDTAAGGQGENWISISGNNPDLPLYPQQFTCNSTDGAVTALSAIKPSDGNNINGAPWLVFRSAATTVNGLAGYVTAGNSRKPMSFAGTVHKTQTSSAEVSDYIIATQKAGTLTEALRITDQGQVVLQESGAGLSIKTGTNCKMGKSTLVTGTVTVSTTAVTASSHIFLTNNVVGGTIGELSVGTVVAGTSFVINSSSALDTSTIAWMIVEPS